MSELLELLLQLVLELVCDCVGAWATWRFCLCFMVSAVLAALTVCIFESSSAACVFSVATICGGVLGGVAWEFLA